MRNKKILSVIIFMLIFMVIAPLFLISPQSSLKTDSLHESAAPEIIYTMDGAGSFIPFTYTGDLGNEGSWDDSGETLYHNVQDNSDIDIETSTAIWDFTDISTNLITNMTGTGYYYWASEESGGVKPNFTAYILYTDGTFSYLSFPWGTWHIDTYSSYAIATNMQFTCNFLPDKVIDKLIIRTTIVAKTGGRSSSYGLTRIYSLYLHGYVPKISNITYPTSIKQGESAAFSCELENVDATLDQNITFIFLETFNTKTETMSIDWTSDNKYTLLTSFDTNGYYRFFITARHGWNYTFSNYFTFYVGDYPKDAYLSLFSNLDGFPLDSKDFKIYLGEDEEQELVNFRTYFGNWTQIYGSSVVNASLIDNYIQFNTTANGIKTNFENNNIYDTLAHDTLLFDAKMSNNSRLVVIYNPLIHEKDYYVDFYQNMSNLWYSIEIPFYYFNQYQNISNDFLHEIGFWIANSSMQLANIRIANHNNKTYLQQSELILNMTNTELSDEVDTHEYTITTPSVLECDTYQFNYTLNITDGYNNSQASWEHVEITNNETIGINNTGHYNGNQTFINDAIGSNPSGWTITEPASTNVEVKAEYLNHNKVLLIDDYSAAGAPSVKHQFQSLTSGIIEFWVNWKEIGGKYDTMTISQTTAPTTNNIYFYDAENTAWGFYDGSNRLLYFENGTAVSRVVDTWYRVKVVFNVSIGWNCYIAIGEKEAYNLLYQDAGHVTSLFGFVGSPTSLSYFNVIPAVAYQSETYLDSIDWSDDPNYFDNRISNFIDLIGQYQSDIINFGQEVNVTNIEVNKTSLANTFTLVYVSDNFTGDFDNFVLYNTYTNDNVQFLKYLVVLITQNTTNQPEFYNISFQYQLYTYGVAIISTISPYTGSYQSIVNSTTIFRLFTNVSISISNISVYNFNESTWENQTFTDSCANYTFFNDTNAYFDPVNLEHKFFLYANSSIPFSITGELIDVTIVYNKTRYLGMYNFTLLDEFEHLYFYVWNNYTSLDASWRLWNTTASMTIGIAYRTEWEGWTHEFDENYGWTTLSFLYEGFENVSLYIREVFETKAETYRLISIENRQNPNNLIFTSPNASIAILDYFDNVLYRSALEYISFVDITLPITTMTFYNFYSEFIYVTVQRGLGVEVQVAVAPESSVSLRVFSTSYLLHVRNYELQTLLLTDFSPDSSEQVTFQFGERQNVDFDAYNDFLLKLLIWIIIGLIAFIITFEIYNRIQNKRESQKNKEGLNQLIRNEIKKQNQKQNRKVIL